MKETEDRKTVIRLARAEDVRDIQEVLHQTWLATYPNQEAGITLEDVEDSLARRGNERSLEERERNLRELPAGEHVLVAEDDGKVVGMCRFIVRDEVNQLLAIYVLPQMQGQGVGQKLWNEAITFADPNKDTIVQVATYNTGAIKFYEKLGFVDTGKRLTDERFRMKSGSIIPEMEMILRKYPPNT